MWSLVTENHCRTSRTCNTARQLVPPSISKPRLHDNLFSAYVNPLSRVRGTARQSTDLTKTVGAMSVSLQLTNTHHPPQHNTETRNSGLCGVCVSGVEGKEKSVGVGGHLLLTAAKFCRQGGRFYTRAVCTHIETVVTKYFYMRRSTETCPTHS